MGQGTNSNLLTPDRYELDWRLHFAAAMVLSKCPLQHLRATGCFSTGKCTSAWPQSIPKLDLLWSSCRASNFWNQNWAISPQTELVCDLLHQSLLFRWDGIFCINYYLPKMGITILFLRMVCSLLDISHLVAHAMNFVWLAYWEVAILGHCVPYQQVLGQ